MIRYDDIIERTMQGIMKDGRMENLSEWLEQGMHGRTERRKIKEGRKFEGRKEGWED